MRKMIVAGNWKMNVIPSQADKLINEIKPEIRGTKAEVILCVPAIDIIPAVGASKESAIKIGAENVHYEESGAFTGEMSPDMLTDAGTEYVIVGHSERRQYFNEDNNMVNRKARKALEHNIIPIICCGETIEQREAGITLDFIRSQIEGAFAMISVDDAKRCIIAYEPIWAIGTGRVATTEQAQEVCEAIRRFIREIYDEDVADSIRILYGGSVNVSNAEEIFAQPDIDGGLVGGASLKKEFAQIVNSVK